MDINIFIQLILGIIITAAFGILFVKRSKKEAYNTNRIVLNLIALSGIVIGASIFLNAMSVLILKSGFITVDALFNNENAYPILLTVASLAIMLNIAYFQYLLQQQESKQNAKDIFAQSMLDISQFECSGELLNYNIENCRAIFVDKIIEPPCPFLMIKFGDAFLKNYIEISNLSAKLTYNNQSAYLKRDDIISYDNYIKLLLREENGSFSNADFLNDILLAPYSVPYAKRSEFMLTLIFSFIDHRYPGEHKNNPTLELALTFSFEPYKEYGTSQMEIITKRMKAIEKKTIEDHFLNLKNH